MSSHRVAAMGFVVGLVFGQGGGMVSDPHLADLLWAISSIGLVVGAILVGVYHGRRGDDLVAAGFLILAMAECVMWSGGSMATESGRQAFGAGTLYYVPALLAISAPSTFPIVVRAGGIGSALAFSVHAARFVLGDARPSSDPAAIAGYVLLTVAAIGWSIRAWGRGAPERADVSVRTTAESGA